MLVGNGNYKEKEVVLRVHIVEVTHKVGKVPREIWGFYEKRTCEESNGEYSALAIEYTGKLVNDTMSCFQGLTYKEIGRNKN